MDDIDSLLQSVMDSHEEDMTDTHFLEEAAPDELTVEEDVYDNEVSTDKLYETGATMVDDTADMSEEEIAQLLESSQLIDDGAAKLPEESNHITDDDFLSDILKEQDDADLKEIQELLQKADKNEEIESGDFFF